MQSKLISNLRGVHGIGKILLVSEDKEYGMPELILARHPLQLLTSLRNTFPIIRVDDKNDTLGVLEVWVVGLEVRTCIACRELGG
jgi:hypothetical protein